MTDQPDQGSESSTPADPTAAPLDFDPYRFGKPDHPVPPEYAPPGYVPDYPPPQPVEQKPVWPPTDDATKPPAYAPYQQYPPPQYQPGQHQPPQYQPGQYQPHPPAPPGYPAYGMVRQGNGKATTAMVLGILGIIFFWLTILDLGLAIPAIVVGALALRDANRFPERGGRGKAIAGLVCGIISVVLVIVAVVFVYVRIKPCLDYGINSSEYNSCVQDKL